MKHDRAFAQIKIISLLILLLHSVFKSSYLRYAALAIFLASFVAGCGSAGTPPTVAPEPDPEPIVITEVDLEHLLSNGLPVILNFGDDNDASQETLANLEKLNAKYHDKIIIRSVDLTQNPEAREGFPAPDLPTQFFYTAEGKPIPLPLGYGPFMSSFVPVDSDEAVFTAHEGPLDEEGIHIVMEIMGLD